MSAFSFGRWLKLLVFVVVPTYPTSAVTRDALVGPWAADTEARSVAAVTWNDRIIVFDMVGSTPVTRVQLVTAGRAPIPIYCDMVIPPTSGLKAELTAVNLIAPPIDTSNAALSASTKVVLDLCERIVESAELPDAFRLLIKDGQPTIVADYGQRDGAFADAHKLRQTSFLISGQWRQVGYLDTKAIDDKPSLFGRLDELAGALGVDKLLAARYDPDTRTWHLCKDDEWLVWEDAQADPKARKKFASPSEFEKRLNAQQAYFKNNAFPLGSPELEWVNAGSAGPEWDALRAACIRPIATIRAEGWSQHPRLYTSKLD